MSDVKLLPCPFCGKAPEWDGLAHCGNEECRIVVEELDPDHWNHRAADPHRDAVVTAAEAWVDATETGDMTWALPLALTAIRDAVAAYRAAKKEDA